MGSQIESRKREMLADHRMSNSAIRGCLIAAAILFAFALFQNDKTKSYSVQEAAAEEKADADKTVSTHFAPGFKVDADTYRAICDQPKDKDHADLCQQWRMAEAADLQILLNAAGLALLIGTLVFTGWAAIAASRAANAAQASVLEAANTAKNELRAYLAAIEFEVIYDRPKGGLDYTNVLRTTVKNVGQTPAHDVIIIVQWQCFPVGQVPGDDFPESLEKDEFKASFAGGTPSKVYLSPGQTYVGDMVLDDPDDGWKRTVAREFNLYIFGRIHYRDIFGRRWRHTFCRQWEPYVPNPIAHFTPYKKYNDEQENLGTSPG